MPLDHDVLPTFALVRFRRGPGAAAEPGVFTDGRVHPLDLAALGAASLNDVFERWDELEGDVRATGRGQDGLALDDVVLTAPVEPRQVLQTGANYRTHVIDLEVGHMAKDDPRPVEEVREAIGRMMDERAAHGQPVLLPRPRPDASSATTRTSCSPPTATSTTGSSSSPRSSAAPRSGSPARTRSTTSGAGRSSTTSRPATWCSAADMPEIGTDWYRGKNAPGFNPIGPVRGAALGRARARRTSSCAST